MNWTTQSKVIITNIVSMLALALGLFGIDVSPDAQAQLVAGIGAAGLIVTTVIAAFRSRKQLEVDEVDAAVKISQKQGGYVHPNTLVAMALMSALVVGCAGMLPETPRQVLTASYLAVEEAAESTAIAYRDGHITDEQRQRIKGYLQRALDDLKLAEAMIIQGIDSDEPLQSARRVLLLAQQYLIEAQTNE